jgi:hypothetical protein
MPGRDVQPPEDAYVANTIMGGFATDSVSLPTEGRSGVFDQPLEIVERDDVQNLVAGEVVVPAASYYESRLCRMVLDELGRDCVGAPTLPAPRTLTSSLRTSATNTHLAS